MWLTMRGYRGDIGCILCHSSVLREVRRNVPGPFFLVCGAWQSYLEQLYANDGEHELQEAGDEDYVSDSLYRYDDALYYVLGSTLIIM